uniref:NADH-ubiquinone oxidoreductase chain 6 n=1 Tax=Megalophasma granulatum TaxID=2042296 RepID=A0A343KJT6_9NEOP|nr:NADH dehydrogenase subunit 6 [Megalophasma granulatum]
MKMIMLLNMTMNSLFIITKHPLSMGLTIIMQTIIISMTTSIMYKSSWFSFILFMMYVGGMMVLFIYVISLIPNMLFTLNLKNMSMIIMIMMMSMMLIPQKYFTMNTDMNMMNNNILNNMYAMPFNMLIIMMASYLLFTMITVFKIIENNKSPLRMMN